MSFHQIETTWRVNDTWQACKVTGASTLSAKLDKWKKERKSAEAEGDSAIGNTQRLGAKLQSLFCSDGLCMLVCSFFFAKKVCMLL